MVTRLKKEKHTCAACGGNLKDKTINIVFWRDHAVELCDSCLQLGDGVTKSVSEVIRLLDTRANPRAQRGGFENRVQAWIRRQSTDRDTRS